MLNELLEYDEYTYTISDDTDASDFYRKDTKGSEEISHFRLHPTTLKHGGAGVPRAMVMIARKILFDKDLDALDFLTKRVIIRTLLESWYYQLPDLDAVTDAADMPQKFELYLKSKGVVLHQNSPEHQACIQYFRQLSGWLNIYLKKLIECPKEDRSNMLQVNCKEKLRNYQNKLNEKSRSMRRYLYTYANDEKKEEKNTLNAVTYNGIIASAIVDGPLCEQFLAYKGNPFEKIRINTAKKTYTVDDSKNKKYIDRDKDTILKVTAAFLMNRIDREEYAHVTLKEISNWLYVNNTLDALYSRYSYVVQSNHTEGGKKYIKYPLVKNMKFRKKLNYTKIRVEPQWIEKYDIRLCSEEDISELKSKGYSYTVLKDQGSGKPLKPL